MTVLGVLRIVLACLVFLAYPYLVYRGLDSGIVWIAPLFCSIFYARQAYLTTNRELKVTKLLIAVLCLLGTLFLQSVTAKLIPIFIQLMLMHFFGRTLFTRSTLIERFVRFDYPDLPAEVLVYARQLTVLWTGFFAFNALMCAVLAIWGSDFWWAIYNGVMIYSLTAALILGEYIYRHFRFPGWEIPPLKSSIRNIIVNGRSIWVDAHE